MRQHVKSFFDSNLSSLEKEINHWLQQNLHENQKVDDIKFSTTERGYAALVIYCK